MRMSLPRLQQRNRVSLDQETRFLRQGRSMTVDNLLVKTKDLLRSCFAPTDICGLYVGENGENINLVGAKHSGRYFWVKMLTLIPECAGPDIYGRKY